MKPVWRLGLETTQLRELVDAARIPSSIIQSALEATRLAEKMAIPREQMRRIEEAMRQAQETARFASRIIERIPLALSIPTLDVYELPSLVYRRPNLALSSEFLDENSCEWEISEDPEEVNEQPMRRIGFY